MKSSHSIGKALLASLAALLFAAHASATDTIDDAFHAPFDAVLKANVVDGHVNYSGVAADSRFHAYVAALAGAKVPENLPLASKLAFWINAYNALAIQGIIEGRSPSSFFGRVSYFKRDEYAVAGLSITLYDLERDIIIPLGDNRIHFAIVCASQSCPPLRSEAFVSEMLDAQLDEQAQLFLGDETKNSFDLDRNRANVSKIFDWFADDFAAEAGSVQRYIAKFVDDAPLRDALAAERLRVKHKKYDWNLNGTPPPET